MEPADSILRLGFGRWYERRLIEGHVWFVTSFLCLVAVLACLEDAGARGSVLRVLTSAGLILAATVIGVYALIRYKQILTEALRLGELARCPGCGAYARFRMLSDFHVGCRACPREWRLIEPAGEEPRRRPP